MYVCSRRYKVYVLTKILLTFKCICAQEDFTNFINFKCICAQEDYTFYQKFLGVPTLGVNTKTRRRRHGAQVKKRSKRKLQIFKCRLFATIFNASCGIHMV